MRQEFGGREELNDVFIKDARWDFWYAAQLKYQVNEKLALAAPDTCVPDS
jgi:hypothetical protein